MRRVVSDQIKALKELAAVVAESGAEFDLAEPAVEAAAPTLVSRARAEEPRGAESPPAARAAPALAQPALAGPGPASRPSRVEVSPPAVLPSAPAVSPPDRGQPGWLSNLLAAASRDEPSEAPDARPAGETLDALTQDIAELIDTDAASEMWERWRRGDAGAVTRRLYTEQGQATFDEIRRRCRTDAQFRDTVTRYTQEFERLLAKIAQSDRDGSQWRAYLLSNTGKVYTMLAHASGRLG